MARCIKCTPFANKNKCANNADYITTLQKLSIQESVHSTRMVVWVVRACECNLILYPVSILCAFTPIVQLWSTRSGHIGHACVCTECNRIQYNQMYVSKSHTGIMGMCGLVHLRMSPVRPQGLRAYNGLHLPKADPRQVQLVLCLHSYRTIDTVSQCSLTCTKLLTSFNCSFTV